MKPRRRRSRLSTRKKILFSVVTLFTLAALLYLGALIVRSHRMYAVLTSREHEWDGQIHQADAQLGFRPVPNSSGPMYNRGFPVDVRYDRDGFRVPTYFFDPPESYYGKRPTVMAVGDSFTFGDACRAEQAFPFLLGQALDGREMNAGVCSHGLTQMVLRAERLIPKHKPDYVIVQYSPWLTLRSKMPFAHSEVLVPVPYYCQRDDQVAIQLPLYQTRAFDVKAASLQDLPKGFFGFLRFSARVSFRFLISEDWHFTRYTVGEFLGFIPPPATDDVAMARAAYHRIRDVAKEEGSKMLIVLLSRTHEKVEIPPGAFPDDIPVVDAHGELLNRLETLDEESFLKAYWSRLGTPPMQVPDEHPNPPAHRIIADQIFKEIRSHPALKYAPAQDGS